MVEHGLGGLVAPVEPCVAKSGVGLVDVVPGNPVAVLRAGVACLELQPHRLPVGDAAEVAHEVGVLAVGVLGALEFAHHIVHARLDLRIAGGRVVHGQGAEVVPSHVPVEPRPVGECRALGRESRLLQEGLHQAVDVVGQKRLAVEIHPLLEGTVQQLDIAQREHGGVQLLLGECVAGAEGNQGKCDQDGSAHGINPGIEFSSGRLRTMSEALPAIPAPTDACKLISEFQECCRIRALRVAILARQGRRVHCQIGTRQPQEPHMNIEVVHVCSCEGGMNAGTSSILETSAPGTLRLCLEEWET